MNKTDDILERLKGRMPSTPNPDELTERIMEKLDSLPAKRKPVLLPLVRTVLSLAAMWIVGLFIFLQFETTTPKEEKGFTLSELPQSGATLREVYKNRLCRECKKTISYTKIRSMLYENK